MTKLVGILNYTENSFSDGRKFNKLENALEHLEKLINDGADIIDIGAQSTSYNAPLMGHQQEWEKLEPLLRLVASPQISVDTFNFETAAKAIRMGVGYINDVNGGKDKNMLNLLADNPHVKYICMFSLVLPAHNEVRIKSYGEVLTWAEKQIDVCLNAGIRPHQLILDPGIGFSTGADNSFLVIKNVAELKKFGFPVMIGHSRKSFFNMLSSSNFPPAERDIETVAASIYMFQKEVDYLRIHNVEMHKRSLSVFRYLSKNISS
jgi:dihydropteroate synthase